MHKYIRAHLVAKQNIIKWKFETYILWCYTYHYKQYKTAEQAPYHNHNVMYDIELHAEWISMKWTCKRNGQYINMHINAENIKNKMRR